MTTFYKLLHSVVSISPWEGRGNKLRIEFYPMLSKRISISSESGFSARMCLWTSEECNTSVIMNRYHMLDFREKPLISIEIHTGTPIDGHSHRYNGHCLRLLQSIVAEF